MVASVEKGIGERRGLATVVERVIGGHIVAGHCRA